MIWSCISSNRVGRTRLLEKEERFNAESYIQVLKDRLLPTARKFFGDNECYFQGNGVPCHRAKIVKTFLNENEIRSIPWSPGQSPD